MLLLVPDNKTEEDYKRWSARIGKPSELGVQLQVGISYSDRSGPHVVVVGVVGVPRPPEDDLEREMLAWKLAELVESPDIAIFEFTGLMRWRVVKGGPFEIELTESRHIRELDKNEVSNTVTLSGPGPMNEPVFRTRFSESEDWAREYAANRYLRFENRAGLNQRYQDLITNITVLTETGKLALTDEKHWHRLFKHVVQEMFLRGEPPMPKNFHPTVAQAILFPDKNLCEQAADAVGKVRVSGPVLVKYGKADRMRALYERGDVYMPPATVYDDPEHNQAIHDQELSFSHCGVVTNQFAPLKAHDVFANPDVLRAPDHRFLPLFHAPDAAEDEIIRAETSGPDAWMYCMSTLLAPRLFSDFSADACVILDRDEFKARSFDALRSLASRSLFAHADVQYIDPVGAYAEQPSPPQVHFAFKNNAPAHRGVQQFSPFGTGAELMRPPEVHFKKVFRFAYQREYRLVSYPPQVTKTLSVPLRLTLGPLNDIGELIIL